MTSADDIANGSFAARPVGTPANVDNTPGWAREFDGVGRDIDFYPDLYEHRIPDCGAPYGW